MIDLIFASIVPVISVFSETSGIVSDGVLEGQIKFLNEQLSLQLPDELFKTSREREAST
ncbi:MAG: hypothetical protein V4623_00410 [Pseudomonadota bacterium]